MDEPEFVVSKSGGRKQKKPDRWDLLPWDALRELAELYGKGVEKYEERNWENGLDFNWSYRALINHAQQWWMGEDRDEEMDAHHLACVAFHALGMLALQERHGDEWDNRPNTPVDEHDHIQPVVNYQCALCGIMVADDIAHTCRPSNG